MTLEWNQKASPILYVPLLPLEKIVESWPRCRDHVTIRADHGLS